MQWRAHWAQKLLVKLLKRRTKVQTNSSVLPDQSPASTEASPEVASVAAAEARSKAPVLVGSLEAVARSRFFTLDADALLIEVAARLSDAQISMVVVCDAAGVALGIVTETVLVRRLGLGEADFFSTRAQDVMTQDFSACAPADLLCDMLAMMHTSGLIHMIMMGADRKPLGVLNARDGLRAMLAAGNHEEALLRNYVMGVGCQ